MINEMRKQTVVRQNSLMTITEYLISIHEDWAFILSDEPEKQLTLFDKVFSKTLAG
jgi:hypothetical protein